MSDEDDRGTGAETPESVASPATDEAAGDDGDDREWRFAVDEFDDEGAVGAAADAEGDDDDEEGNVAGSLLDLEDDVEPGTPTLEGTMFVVLGALATILFLLEAGGAI